MPLRSEATARPNTGPTLWCAIFQVARKHATENCHLLQKFVQTPQHLFCNFCQSVGHDEHNCWSYELMMGRTLAYRVQAEMRPLDQGTRGARGVYQGHDWGRGGGGPSRGRRKIICYNCGGPRHYTRDCPNPMWLSCRYCTQFDHAIDHAMTDCPILLAKIHDKGV